MTLPETPSSPYHVRSVVDLLLDHCEKIITGNYLINGPGTGLDPLDELLRGLMPGLHMLAGRPGSGRTNLMFSIAGHLSINQNIPSLIFSGEIPAYQAIRNMISPRAGQTDFLSCNSLDVPKPGDHQRLKNAAEEIANAPLFIHDTFEPTIEEIRSIAWRYHRTEKIGFIGIDHLDLLRSRFATGKRVRKKEVAEIVIQLAQLAEELAIPIFLIGTLSGKSKSQKVYIPRKQHIRHYMLIERNFKTITFLSQPMYSAMIDEEREELRDTIELLVCKNSGGDTGCERLRFGEEIRDFTDNS